jgi:fatty-acyl-CoA synthase
VSTRSAWLDGEAIAFILQHGEAKVLLVDKEFGEPVQRATSPTER